MILLFIAAIGGGVLMAYSIGRSRYAIMRVLSIFMFIILSAIMYLTYFEILISVNTKIWISFVLFALLTVLYFNGCYRVGDHGRAVRLESQK
jgi:hypothetical protein